MGMVVNPFWLHALSLEDFVSNDGANLPFVSAASYPGAFYDSSGNKTWLAWEGWNGANRTVRVAGYDHDTSYWTDITEAGSSPLVDDTHGIPAICMDDEGHLHAFYGSHSTNHLYSSTRWAAESATGQGSFWAIRDPFVGAYTYSHPVPLGSDIYLFLRKTINASTKLPLVLFKTATLAGGVATWGSEITLVDFGTDSRFYKGTIEAVGTDIHIVATRADYLDTFREDLYYFIYDTVTGAVKNHDGSFSVASGSLPVGLSDADTNYRLFAHSGGSHDGGMPTLCFDSGGDPHILFKDGTGDPTGTFDVKYIKRTSGTWSSPETLATVTDRFTCPVIIPLSGDRVEAWYPQNGGRYGDMVRRVRSSAGAWGPPETILAAGVIGLGEATKVRNGLASARIAFAEAIGPDESDASAGDLRLYLYGSGGLVEYQQEPEAATTPDALQLNTETLQLNGEDLTLGV